MVPSIENTPSVNTSCEARARRRAACQAALQVGHVVVGVAVALALHRRMPSMMEAWFSASLK
jgi:hypothetical protein